jgi:signal peptidase
MTQYTHNAPSPEPPGTDPTPRRGLLLGLREFLLNMAAVGGAVCILLVVLALLFDITLIMFKTGSMSPTIPAGSVALVQEIPAADVATGDVITVDRPGSLPITHRVTSVTDAGGDTRIITMKGDANDTEDPAPYTVNTVRRVLGSVPGLAPVIVHVSEPPVLAGITLAVAGLVTWGSWPSSSTRRTTRHARGPEAPRTSPTHTATTSTPASSAAAGSTLDHRPEDQNQDNP